MLASPQFLSRTQLRIPAQEEVESLGLGSVLGTSRWEASGLVYELQGLASQKALSPGLSTLDFRN